jgi:hypothetical protein
VKPRTLPEYLEVLYQSLDLAESARLRILAEVRDHLTEAVEEAVAAGTDPKDAVEATLRAFGDPVLLAASFSPGPWRLFLRGWRRWRWSVDLLHARHPVSYTTFALLALFGFLLLAQAWLLLCWMPFYVAQQIWLAQRIARRSEIGFSARLEAFWQEHPTLHQVYSLLFMLPLAFYLVLNRAFPPGKFPWNLLVLPAAIFLGWLFFWPRARPATPPVAAAD